MGQWFVAFYDRVMAPLERGGFHDMRQEYRKFTRPFPLPLPRRSPQCCRGSPRHRERPPARASASEAARQAPSRAPPAQRAAKRAPGALLQTSGTVWACCHPLAHATTLRRGCGGARRGDTGWDNEPGRAARDGCWP